MTNDKKYNSVSRAGSSFFKISYAGKKVLVLVPHQDDEINVAANSINNFVNAGAEVFVMFSTNGDYEFSADIRLGEAANSLSVLGLERSHIFCLGYGDTVNNSPEGHIFYSQDKAITSPHGNKETYGGAGFQDFAFLTRKEHSKYCRHDFLRDLRELILYVKADIILAVDFDSHSDHRMLSLSFDDAMREILSRPENDYRPEIFKRFAYSTAFTAPLDFFADNLIETQKPITSKNEKEIIDTSFYSWDKRVRFPVPEGSRITLLENNIIADALNMHVSQKAILHAEQVINSDEVFFSRRTDSLSYNAEISSSSGNANYVNDFKLINVINIDDEAPEWQNYLWLPEENDEKKELIFNWRTGQKISLVRFWGNIDGLPVKRVKISMNNGFTQEAENFPAKGLPFDMKFPVQDGITELRIKIIEQGSSESGFAEIEIFEHFEQQAIIQPFIQITSSENFIYDYNRKPDENILSIECYAYRINSPVINYEVTGPAKFDGEKLIFDADKNDDVILRASVDGGKIFCQSVFHKVSMKKFDELRSIQAKIHKSIKRQRFMYKHTVRIKKYSRMLVQEGVFCTIKKITKKIIEKLGKKLKGD